MRGLNGLKLGDDFDFMARIAVGMILLGWGIFSA